MVLSQSYYSSSCTTWGAYNQLWRLRENLLHTMSYFPKVQWFFLKCLYLYITKHFLNVKIMNCCGGHLEFPTENKTNFVKENHMTLHVVWSSISLLISEKMVFKILFHKNQCKAVSHYNSHLGFPTD